jgi:two-component system, NarL family, response regulator NreC
MAARLGLAEPVEDATRPSEAVGGDAAGASEPDRLITVALADDGFTARRSLRALLDSQSGVKVVGEPAEPAEPAERAGSRLELGGELPDVLVLALNAPGTASIATLRALHERAPSVRIVVLAPEANPVFARRALDAGASCYVLTQRTDRELPEAIDRAAAGAQFVSPQIAAAFDGLRAAAAEDGLTPREIEVLRLTALGFTGAEIARQLQLSRRTVESHRATIHRKLGLATRAELVGYALGQRLLGA